MVLSFSGDAGGSGSAGDEGSQLLEVDSKAMRRVETGYGLVFVIANGSASTQIQVALSLRALGSESR